MKKPLLILAATGGVVFGGATAAHALFGEENVTLIKQLTELMGISNNTYQALHEAREAVDLAREARDNFRRAEALVEDVQSYTVDRFLDDLKDDAFNTFPDLEYIVDNVGADGLRGWDTPMQSPITTYDLIGQVFGEVTKDLKKEQEEGNLQTENAALYRFESAAALSASDKTKSFIDSSNEDLEVLIEQLDTATKEQAIVIQAKIQAIAAAQNSHILHLLSLQVRREGIEDARNYSRTLNSLRLGMEIRQGQEEIAEHFKERPQMMKFDNSWMDMK